MDILQSVLMGLWLNSDDFLKDLEGKRMGGGGSGWKKSKVHDLWVCCFQRQEPVIY